MGVKHLKETICSSRRKFFPLTLLHSKGPKLYTILAFVSPIGSKVDKRMLFLLLPPFSIGIKHYKERICSSRRKLFPLTLLHSEGPKFYAILAILSVIGLRVYQLLGFCHPGQQTDCQRNCFSLIKGQKNVVYPYTSAPIHYSLLTCSLLLCVTIIMTLSHAITEK